MDQENITQLANDDPSNIRGTTIPQIDMEFDSEEAAYQFYNEYAYATGFSIRRASSHKDRNGKIIDRTFCCSCEGKRTQDKRDINVKRPRPETRTYCCAKMKISARYTIKYQVVTFVVEHTGHDLVSHGGSHILRSHRRINEGQAAQLDYIDNSGIAPKAGLHYMAQQVGGRQNLGFLVEDFRNFLRSKRTKQMEEGDARGLLHYLKSKQYEDSNFFYAVQVDKDDLIASVFWTDGQMKADYGYFGDVVCFDTTYKINSEERPCALFVGVNHHKQSTLFGVSLLYDETADTFMWLFDTFVKAMNGKKPVTILTDQDAAMAKALEERWPETHHRLCIWHIYKNAAIHLNHVLSSREFRRDFKSCIYDYEEEEEFIDAWRDLLKRYNLEKNDWLARMFKLKEKWALVYGRQMFCANMISTQRSESMNGALKKYVGCKHNILRFFQHFGRLLDDRRYEEMKADLRTNQSTPNLPLEVEILKYARTIYTHAIFKLFQDEWSKAHDSKLEILYESEGTSQYKISPFQKQYHHIVTFDAYENKVSCSCKKYEFAGILCSHALKVFTTKNIMTIPEFYIMKRWTKKAKRGMVETSSQSCSTFGESSKNTEEENEKLQIREHYRELSRLFSQITTRAAPLKEAYEFAHSQLIKTLEGVERIWENKTHVKLVTQSIGAAEYTLDKNENISDDATVRGWKKKDNPKVKSGKRLKSGLEQAIGSGKRKRRKNSAPTSSLDGKLEDNGKDLNSNMGLANSAILQRTSYPFIPSMAQIPQIYGVGASSMTSTHPQFGMSYAERGHSFPFVNHSQMAELNTLNPQQFNHWPLYLQNQMPQGQDVGLFQLQNSVLQTELQNGDGDERRA